MPCLWPNMCLCFHMITPFSLAEERLPRFLACIFLSPFPIALPIPPADQQGGHDQISSLEAEIPSAICSTADNRRLSKVNAAVKDHAGKDRGRLLVENRQPSSSFPPPAKVTKVQPRGNIRMALSGGNTGLAIKRVKTRTRQKASI